MHLQITAYRVVYLDGILLMNLTILNNNGAILYYAYPFIPMSKITLGSVNLTDNVLMIIIKESGVATEFTDSYLEDTSIM